MLPGRQDKNQQATHKNAKFCVSHLFILKLFKMNWAKFVIPSLFPLQYVEYI